MVLGHATAYRRVLIKFSKAVLPVLAIAAAIAVAALLRATKPETPAGAPHERTWMVETVPVVFTDVQPELRLFGAVVAGREVALRALVAGQVIETAANFTEGGFVRQGALLVAIDPFAFDQDLVERRAEAREARARLDELGARADAEQAMLAEDRRQLDISQRDVARREQLVGGAVSEKTLDDARAAHSRAQNQVIQGEREVNALTAQNAQQRAVIERLDAVVARAERDLADTRLRAPFDGYLADIDAARGQRLNRGDRVARLIDSGRLEARVYLSDAQFATLDPDTTKAPDRATVIWRVGERAHVFDAEIDRIASEIDPAIGGIHVYARILGAGPEVPLRPGAFIEMRLADRPYSKVAQLPESTLHGGDTVYAVVEGRLAARTVHVLGYNRENVLVRGELKAGEPIVTTRLTEIGPGVKVTVAP